MYSSPWLWIYAASKAPQCQSKSVQTDRRHYCHTSFPLSSARHLFRSGKLCNLDISMHREKQTPNREVLRARSLETMTFAAIPRLCSVSLPPQKKHLRGGGVLHDHKTQTHFSRLIGACLTCALRCYLQTSTFIPTQPDTSKVPPLPPPADFAPVPSYLASIRRHRLGTGLY